MTPAESTQLDARLEFAVELARQAGELTLGYFRSANLESERKGDGSPVTAADREAEALLRRLIGQRFPNDAILGEEFGESGGNSGFRWILDPIDGTKAFITGVPLYTNLIAVLQDGSPKIGVINAPAAGEMVYAQAGKGCWHALGDESPRPAHVSQISDISEATCVTSSVKSFTTEREIDARHVWDQLQAACRITRTWGDAYGYLLVATGRAEIAIDPAMSLWDSASLPTIIEEAGGKFFDWQGKPSIHSCESIATTPALAPLVLTIVQSKQPMGQLP